MILFTVLEKDMSGVLLALYIEEHPSALIVMLWSFHKHLLNSS